MKTLYSLLLCFLCYNNSVVYADCFNKEQMRPAQYQSIPLPVVQQQPLVAYAPFLVQERRLVPIVENRIIYRPVGSYYYNTYHYYPYVPTYEYRYYNDPWNGYNY
jgi:hypothetical protein